MSESSLLISFICSFMVCEGYEWIEERLLMLVDNIQHFCKKFDITYEIVLCEQIGKKNKLLIGDTFREIKNVKVLTLDANYPSKFGYNYIESYGKNECLRNATGEYVCSINSDILPSEPFFQFISKELKHKTFYRFATYEVNHTAEKDVEKIVSHCEANKVRLCNPGCFNPSPSFADIGQKSGDIMLLDTKSFQYIGGYPINECYYHVDTSVCIVAMNNFPVIVPPPHICIYTMLQTHRQGGVNPVIDRLEWEICLGFLNKKFTN